MSISLYDAVPGRQYKGLTLDGVQTGELSLNLYGNPYGVPNAGPTETTPNNPYYLVNASGRHRITESILIAEETEALLKRRDIGQKEYGCDAGPSPLRSEIRNDPAKFRELLFVYTEEEGRLDKLELFRGELNGDGGYTFAIDPTTVTPFEELSFCWVDGKAVEIRNTNICSLPGPSAEEVFANKARFHERLWIYYKTPWSDFELGEIFKAERFVEAPRLGKVYKFKDFIMMPREIKYLTFCILRDRINIPDCTICSDPVGLIRYTPLCGNIHTEVYHKECLSNIIRVNGENGERETKPRCPICRNPFTRVRDTPVYELASAPPLPAAAVSPLSAAPTAAASAEVPPVSAAPTAAEIGPQSPSALAAAAASERARSRGCFGLGCIGGRSRRSKKYRKQKTKRKLKRRTIRK